MKQTVWVGSLLIVPLAAGFIWMVGADDGKARREARTPTRLTVELEDQERLDVAQPEAPTFEPGRSLSGDSPRQTVPEAPAELPDDDSEEESDPAARDSRIRLPVILAIRGKHSTPEARREAILDALRNSGSSSETWTRQSISVFDEWTRGLSGDIEHQADWTSAQCYQAGCEVELIFPDRASYERAASAFRSLHENDATHGGRVQTPAVEGDDGKLRASWIMLRPDDSHS